MKNHIEISLDLQKNLLKPIYLKVCPPRISLICLDPFFVKMKGVVSSRQNLLYFLKYNFKSTFFSFESQLEDICKQYNDAYLILLKAISRKGNRIYIKNASQLLISAAKCEERLSREILDLM